MTHRAGIVLSLRKTVSLVETGPQSLALEHGAGRIPLTHLSSGMREAWRALASTGATERAIADSVAASDDAVAAALLLAQLRRFDELGFLQYSIVADRLRMTIVPMTAGCYFSSVALEPAALVRLSRFAYCRRLDDTLILESPLSTARAILPGDGAALVALLAAPRSCEQLCDALEAAGSPEKLDREAVGACLSLLAAAGYVAAVDSDGRLPEETDPALVQWEFHDLAFHARSRLGRHDYASGGTFPFRDRIAPLPAVGPARSADVVRLSAPDPQRPAVGEAAFDAVLESRASVREHGRAPITVEQLGEFLFRTARVRSLRPPDASRAWHYEASSRPYPSGGATYDLEVYLAVHACAGLSSGLYHYHPIGHQLERLPAPAAGVEQLLRDAQQSALLTQPPQILITLASRFQRLSWKYRSISYATTLKNVGVLFQTMYLVATAMGLAPCALGGGNSAVFAAAAGTNEFEESSVGEFLLGSRETT
jgi:SagB-type dehydrogenase family enzyme